jgi:replicative DNA helicase
MGYAADDDADEIVNRAQADIYAVTDIRGGALDEIEVIGSRSGEMTGVPTGFTYLDSLSNGLHPGITDAARLREIIDNSVDEALGSPMSRSS